MARFEKAKITISIATLTLSIFTFFYAQTAQKNSRDAKVAAETIQLEIENRRRDSALQANLLSYAHPHIMQMLNSPETYESSCNIALAYGDIEKNSGSEYIATLVSKLVWKRKVLDKNDNCGGYADEILATSAAVPLKVDNMALGEIPVVGTYKFNNCKIALKARDLFRKNMKPLFDGDKGQYEVGVSNAHARVIYVTDDNSVEASLSALRAQGKAAQSRVDMGDRSTGTYNFDSQNLRHAAGAYLGNAANWKIITDSNASLCQRGAHLSEYN